MLYPYHSSWIPTAIGCVKKVQQISKKVLTNERCCVIITSVRLGVVKKTVTSILAWKTLKNTVFDYSHQIMSEVQKTDTSDIDEMVKSSLHKKEIIGSNPIVGHTKAVFNILGLY